MRKPNNTKSTLRTTTTPRSLTSVEARNVAGGVSMDPLPMWKISMDPLPKY
jgi:hypothetical protein